MRAKIIPLRYYRQRCLYCSTVNVKILKAQFIYDRFRVVIHYGRCAAARGYCQLRAER